MQFSSSHKHFKQISFLLLFLGTIIFAKAQYVPALTDADINNRVITANTTVGVIDGVYGTSTTGAATYDIPIKVASGINNMVPEISITYNSQCGNGLLGVGWNLKGLSAITLDNKDIYYDNELAPIVLGNSPYNLDGARLVPDNVNSNVFRKEVEDFSVVTATGAIGNPQSFKLQMKTGAVIEYGEISGTVNALVKTAENLPYIWRIAKATDVFGNEIVYNYTYINGESKIDEIIYGVSKIKFIYSTRSDKNSSFFSKLPFDNNNGVMNNNSLLKNIEITTDNGATLVKKYEFIYMYDGLYSFLQEVKEIGSDNSSVINSTLLKYGNPTDLTTPSTIPVENTNISSGSLTDFQGVENYSGDFNGDGLSDILTAYYAPSENNIDPYSTLSVIKVYRNYKIFLKVPNSNNFTEAYNYNFPFPIANNNEDRYTYLFKVADFNGDGRSDVLIDRYLQTFSGLCCISKIGYTIAYSFPSSSSLDIISLNYNMSDYISSDYLPYKYVDYYVNGTQNLQQNLLVTGDFDGDGAMDILQTLYNSSKESISMVSFPNKGEWYKPVLVLPDQISPSTPVNNVTITNKIVGVADFDGDKRDELFTNGRKIFKLDPWGSNIYFLNQISGSINSTFLPLSSNNKDFVGDFNGDGKADILTYIAPAWKLNYSGNGNNLTTVYFTNTISFDLPYDVTPSDPNYTNVNFRNTVPIMSDFNGDGKCDILFLNHNRTNNTSTLDIYYSNGMTFVKAPTKTMPFDYYQLDLVADFNGDGALDILRKNAKFSSATNFPYKISSLVGQNKERLLKKVVDGFNRVTEFNYKYLTDATTTSSSFYADNAYSRTPDVITGLKIPLLLTSSIVSPDGIGGLTTESYYYNNTFFHTKGKGFLGFSSIVMNESTTNKSVLTVNQVPSSSNFFSNPTYFSSNFIGTQVNAPFGGKTTQYSYTDKGNKRFLPQINSTNVVNNIAGTNITTNFTYDIYGNTTQTVVNNSNVETTTTTLTNQDNLSFTVPFLYKDIDETTTRSGSQTFTEKINYTYNAKGSIISSILNKQSSTKPLNINSISYDNFGNKTAVTYSGNTTNGLINITTSTPYSADGRFLQSMVTPYLVNKQIIDGYDTRWGKPLKIRNYLNTQSEEYLYDKFGRTTKITPPASLGYFTEIKYEWSVNPSINSLYKITTSAIGTQVFSPVIRFYDAFDRLVREETTENNKTKFTNNYYNSNGDVIKTETNDANGSGTITTQNTYDIYHRLLTSNNSATGISETNTYTPAAGAGITIVNTTTGQPTKTTKIDPTGKVKEVSENGLTNAYNYHSNGNILSITQSGTTAPLISCEYDENGNQTKLADIDAGITQYVYDAFGNITKQTDANGNEMNMKFDTYGRLFNKTIKDNNYPTLLNNVDYFYYDVNIQGENNIKKIMYTNNIDGTAENITDEFYYVDNFDRLTKFDRTFENNKVFSKVYTYENHKLKTVTYPKVTSAGTALKLTYTMTDNGFITKINANAGTSKDVFNAFSNDYNAFDQITKYNLGYNTVNNYNISNHITSYNAIGLPTNYKAILPWFANAVFQDLTMGWELSTGNLTKRTDAGARSNRLTTIENFEYGTDNFNRLTKTQLSTQTSPLEIGYDAKGNITKKYDAGNDYVYKADKIHAVEKIKAGVGYTNPVKPDDRTDISTALQDIKTLSGAGTATSKYNVFNQPALITEGTNELKYIYDYNGQRIKSIYKESGVLKTTRYYFDDYEFETNGNPINVDANITRQVHYISSPKGLASIMVKEPTTPKYYSTFTDHLGSIVSVVDDNSKIGSVWFYDQSFDAWGRQRNSNDWKTYTYTAPPAWLYRGYTSHEMLPKFNLINMNGRLYDPIVGRMLSPDNFVQEPFNTQSYNRYSYVLNNPLKYTDPSGEAWRDNQTGRMDGAGVGFSNIANYATIADIDFNLNLGIGSPNASNPSNGSSFKCFNFKGSSENDDDYYKEFGDLEAKSAFFMATNFFPNGYVGGIAPMVGAMNYAIALVYTTQQNRYSAISNAVNGYSNGIGVRMPSSTRGFYSQSSSNSFMSGATAGGGDLLGYVSAAAQRARDFISNYRFTSEVNFNLSYGNQFAIDGELLGLKVGGSYKRDVKDYLDFSLEMVGWKNGSITPSFYLQPNKLFGVKNYGYQFTPLSYSYGYTLVGGSYSQKLYNYSGLDYSNKIENFNLQYLLFQSRITKKDNSTSEMYYSTGVGLNLAVYFGIDFSLRFGFKRKY